MSARGPSAWPSAKRSSAWKKYGSCPDELAKRLRRGPATN